LKRQRFFRLEISVAYRYRSCYFGAFLAFVVGGWVTGKSPAFGARNPRFFMRRFQAGRLADVLAFIALGMGKTFGGWYGGLAGASPYAAAAIAAPSPETVDISQRPP